MGLHIQRCSFLQKIIPLHVVCSRPLLPILAHTDSQRSNSDCFAKIQLWLVLSKVGPGTHDTSYQELCPEGHGDQATTRGAHCLKITPAPDYFAPLDGEVHCLNTPRHKTNTCRKNSREIDSFFVRIHVGPVVALTQYRKIHSRNYL